MNTTNNTIGTLMHQNTTPIDDETDPSAQLEQLKKKIKGEISAAKILQRRENKALRELEKVSEDLVPDKQDRIEKQHQVLNDIQNQIDDLQADLKAAERTAKDDKEEQVQDALNKLKFGFIDQTPSAAYIISDKEFVFTDNYAVNQVKLNAQLVRMTPETFTVYAANKLGVAHYNLPIPLVIDLFNNCNRSFLYNRYSIDPEKWGKDVYLPFEHLKPFFINEFNLTPEQDQETEESLKYFDWLMYSLSGNKKENRDHIEKWILHKIINYKKAITTPDIVIVGHVGGNGKGILQAIVRLMLPAMLSGKANTKTLNGNFNAIMLGKLIVFFDDQNSKEIPLDVVKELAGSDTMIFEPKGKDQYEGEKTYSSAWFSQTLPFRLTPAGQEDGVDRRFSIMATNITFLESIRKHMEEETGEKVTVEESKALAEIIVSKHLLNRVCIAKWFKHLAAKHPEVTNDYTLKALHGEDYRYFLKQQETIIEGIFKRLIVPVLEKGGCVPVFVIKELTRHFDNNAMPDKTINKVITTLGAQYKVNLQLTKARIDIVSRTATVKKQCVVVHLTDNWAHKAFDWSLVSSTPYETIQMPGRDLISKDSLNFSLTDSIADDFNGDFIGDDSDDGDNDSPVINVLDDDDVIIDNRDNRDNRDNEIASNNEGSKIVGNTFLKKFFELNPEKD